MSEPTWELLGGGGVVGGPIDYVGAWAAGTTYQPGQVVRHNGVDYLAVNPSLGQTPPFVPALSPARYARVRRDSGGQQSIPSQTAPYSFISFDTKDKDEGGFWSAGQPTRLTIPVTGWYRMRAGGTWAANSTGYREFGIMVNRAIILGYAIVVTTYEFSGAPKMEVGAMMGLSAGDYVEMMVSQNSGVALNINVGNTNYYNGFEIEWIGP